MLLAAMLGMAATSATANCPTGEDGPSEAWQEQSRQSLARNVRYPPAAVHGGVTGTVMLSIDVDRRGTIGTIAIARSSGTMSLDRAALDAARRLESFAPLPCLKHERMRVNIPVRFTLAE